MSWVTKIRTLFGGAPIHEAAGGGRRAMAWMPGNPGAVAYIDKVHALGLHGPPAFGLIDLIVSKEAYTLAENDVFWLFGWLFLVIIPLVWLARPPFNAAAGAGMH